MMTAKFRPSKPSPSVVCWVCVSASLPDAADAASQSGSTRPTGRRGSTEWTTTLPFNDGWRTAGQGTFTRSARARLVVSQSGQLAAENDAPPGRRGRHDHLIDLAPVDVSAPAGAPQPRRHHPHMVPGSTAGCPAAQRPTARGSAGTHPSRTSKPDGGGRAGQSASAA